MADLDLVIDKNKATTMPSTSNVRRVKAPMGTRTLIFSSPSPFYWETPAADKADNTAKDATAAVYMPAGLYDLTVGQLGFSDQFRGQLGQDTFFYFVPTEADQAISFRASSVG